MTHTQVHLSKVTYNAGTQSFEALATVITQTDTKTHACSFEAPMNISFAQAASGLKVQALRANTSNKGMYSKMRHHVAAVRAGRPCFDPHTWLAQLGFGALDKAA